MADGHVERLRSNIRPAWGLHTRGTRGLADLAFARNERGKRQRDKGLAPRQKATTRGPTSAHRGLLQERKSRPNRRLGSRQIGTRACLNRTEVRAHRINACTQSKAPQGAAHPSLGGNKRNKGNGSLGPGWPARLSANPPA